MDHWMELPGDFAGCGIAVYRARVELSDGVTLKYSASADEFCRIFLDGKIIALGPERGCAAYWYRIDGELTLSPGPHVLCAEVFALGKELTAYAQESVAHGFFWHDDAGLFTRWECRSLKTVGFVPPYPDWGAYPRVRVSAEYRDRLDADGEWEKARPRPDGRLLHPRDLPEMRCERIAGWRRRGNIIRFEHYVTAFGHYRFRGCGTVRLRWSETGYVDGELAPATLCGNKGRRDGEVFFGNWDEFSVNGEYEWHDMYFHAGRVLEAECTGSAEIVRMEFFRTGYPWRFRPLPPLDGRSARFAEMALRSVECCTHETFMDCPFYEQMMYLGDARIVARLLYALTEDRALTEKALRFFALSAGADGLPLSRCPAKKDQHIPVYGLIYVLMVADYAEHGGKTGLLREVLPVTRKIVEASWSRSGWQFMDWVESWPRGVPPGDCAMRWFHVLALEAQAVLERLCGNPAREEKYTELAAKNAGELLRQYRDSSGLFADAPQGGTYSEHAQVLALLSKHLPPEAAGEILRAMRKAETVMAETSSYFSFYYLQAMRLHDERELFEKRMERYREFAEAGLDTTPETFGNPRSDCHAWSAHPLLFMLEKQKKGLSTKQEDLL